MFKRLFGIRSLALMASAGLALATWSSPASAFHNGEEKQVFGQGVLYKAVRFEEDKPTEVRSEKKQDEKKSDKKPKMRPAETIYVMGTFHVPSREITNLPPEVIKAVSSSSIAAFETTYDVKPGGWGNMMLLDDGRSLEMILGKKDFERLYKIARKQNKIPRDILNWLKPWAVTFMVGGVPRLAEEAKTGRPVMDHKLLMEAERYSLKVAPLENTQSQLMAFNLWSEEEAVKWVRYFIDNYSPEKSTAHFNKMKELYLKQDLDGLHNLEQEYLFPPDADMDEYRKLHGLFLDWRNENQVEEARRLMSVYGGPMFMAVGAAHLPGEKGVINLLKSQGFEIEKIY